MEFTATIPTNAFKFSINFIKNTSSAEVLALRALLYTINESIKLYPQDQTLLAISLPEFKRLYKDRDTNSRLTVATRLNLSKMIFRFFTC